MNRYFLKTWEIHINDESKISCSFVCNGQTLIIVNTYKDIFVIVKENKDGNLVLEKLPVFIKYEIDCLEKCLVIDIKNIEN